METKGNKPSLGWAILSLVLPVAMILYGTLVVGVRPPVLPLIGAVALAGLMGLKTGYRWEELQEGMFEALGRIQIAIAILALVGMIIAAWLASGTIPAIIYWGLKLIAPEHFLLSAMVLCSVASIATGTSFGTMGTIGVALLGAVLLFGMTNAMHAGIASDAALSPEVRGQLSNMSVDLESNDEFERQLDQVDLTKDERDELVRLDAQARFDSTRAAYAVGAVFVLLGLATTPMITKR